VRGGLGHTSMQPSQFPLRSRLQPTNRPFTGSLLCHLAVHGRNRVPTRAVPYPPRRDIQPSPLAGIPANNSPKTNDSYKVLVS